MWVYIGCMQSIYILSIFHDLILLCNIGLLGDQITATTEQRTFNETWHFELEVGALMKTKAKYGIIASRLISCILDRIRSCMNEDVEINNVCYEGTRRKMKQLEKKQQWHRLPLLSVCWRIFEKQMKINVCIWQSTLLRWCFRINSITNSFEKLISQLPPSLSVSWHVCASFCIDEYKVREKTREIFKLTKVLAMKPE